MLVMGVVIRLFCAFELGFVVEVALPPAVIGISGLVMNNRIDNITMIV